MSQGDIGEFYELRCKDQEKITSGLRKEIEDMKHVTALSKDEAAELVTRLSRENAELRAELDRVSVICDQETDRACDEGVLATKLRGELDAERELTARLRARLAELLGVQ